MLSKIITQKFTIFTDCCIILVLEKSIVVKTLKRKINLFLVLFLSAAVISASNVYAEDSSAAAQPKKKSFLSRIFNKNKQKKAKNKKAKVEEIKLPPVQGKPKIPLSQMTVMTIDDCVKYALEHNPNLKVSQERVEAARAGIGQARSNYAPRFSVGYNIYHKNNQATQVVRNSDNAMGFNVKVSETIWDFGKTTAKIKMAKYDTKAAEYDHEYETLEIIYRVRTNYYKVLSALADLDIYEQNVRIQTLNHERTKAMFDEGLKSKIDVVNAEVNLADAKIQLVEGQNLLLNSIIALQDSMFYQEDKPFVVTNTENFGFLKADYKKKIESTSNTKVPAPVMKKNEDGLVMLSSGIEHNDIIQDYKLNPMKLTKQEAVDKALELRPDFLSDRMLVNVQEESLKAIKRQYAPSINADFSWSYTKDEHSYSSPLQVGAGIDLGSVNPYGIHYQIKEGENMLNIAKHNVNIAKSSIYWEVQDNYINMRQMEREIPLMNTKVRATLENFELADGRYSVGLNNYVELQDALRSYNQAQLNFVESVLKYNIAREALMKSMGLGLDKDGNLATEL